MLIPVIDVGLDGGGEIGDGGEDAPADGLAGEDGEETLNEVEPRAAGWCEVEVYPGVAGQPGVDLGMFVGRVDAPMDVKPRWIAR